MPSVSNDFLAEHYRRALAAAARVHDMQRAYAIAEEAVSRGVRRPEFLGLAARRRLDAGDAASAHALLLQARDLAPRNPGVLGDLGTCLIRMGRAREALAIFDAALRQAPGSAELHFNKALAHEQLSELDGERRHLERALALEPHHVAALNLLSMLAADRNDADAARRYADRALAVSPGEVLARIALAQVDVAARDFTAALSRLDSLAREARLDPDNRALVQTMTGDALDGGGRYGEAFGAYAKAREILARHYAPVFGRDGAESSLELFARLHRDFGAMPKEAWRARPAAVENPRTHVFVAGFLRSGTTLLGQVLAGHPDIDMMHERDCLDEAVRDFIAARDGFARLAAAADAELEPYRQSYWKKAREFGHDAKRAVFVDKSPLATMHLPVIARLFPAARIVFVHRDPRDVVLSCFRRRFAMSRQKYEMLSLAGIADCYDGVMGLDALYRENLALDRCDARHETLIADFETEAQRLCRFLCLEFHPAMRDFAHRARSGNIDVPDSAHLARGLSRESEGRWRHYRAALQPVLGRLARWCRRFGYAES